MNGLRIYTDQERPETRPGDPVFYSRRGSGPFYRWCYEENLHSWKGARMSPSHFNTKDFGIAAWKGLPPALKAKLNEHYLD